MPGMAGAGAGWGAGAGRGRGAGGGARMPGRGVAVAGWESVPGRERRPTAVVGCGDDEGDGVTGLEKGGSGVAGGGPLLLGVRHHGPGSARAVRAALSAARPAVVPIEGPPEADALVPLAADEDMRPPVALLAHAVDEPGRSAFWPLAEFSPEWVAIRWALDHEVPARFIDLPATHTLAWGRDEGDEGPAGRPDDPVGEMPKTSRSEVPGGEGTDGTEATGTTGTEPSDIHGTGPSGEDAVGDEPAAHVAVRVDPLGVLAGA